MTISSYPHSSVLYRSLVHPFPVAVRGEGCWITDRDGKRYLDAVGGAFVATIGHGVTEVADAIARQAKTLSYVNGTQFTAEPVEELAAELAHRAPGDLEFTFFLSSGSDAVEAALKTARQFWVESGRPAKHKILALNPGYHGNTILALSASSRAGAQAAFEPWLTPVFPIPAPYSYRCSCRGRVPPCASCTGQAIEDTILREGPETIAAFIAEPIGGSSTGASVPRNDYWAMVRETCTRLEVLWIADEVLTGVGRTGTWSALEPYGVAPDLMVLGKGLTGGYAPLSAVMSSRRIADAIAAGSGAPFHAQTYINHPLSCAAALAVLRYLDSHELVRRGADMGRLLHDRLSSLRAHPLVGDIRGRGLLAGIELVGDKETRAPFDRSRKIAERCAAEGLEQGIVLWPATGSADGTNGDIIMVAPPLVINEEELDELVRRLDQTLSAVRNQVLHS
ncbi:MAG: aspartate aminotransferase family protein [Gemmatimonadales bacterium]|nr:MAG: aspartate aminotransferase family protein [Gemmatimonadales bacterium]